MTDDENLCSLLSPRKRGRKRPEEITDPVLKRIFEVSGWTRQAEVCRGLDEVESTLSRSLIRGDGVPEIILYKMTEKFPRLRLEWLRHGTGQMYRGNLLVSDLTVPLQAAVSVMLGTLDEAQDVFLRVAQLLATGQPNVIDAFNVMTIGYENYPANLPTHKKATT